MLFAKLAQWNLLSSSMIKAVLFDYGGVLSKGGQSVKHDIATILGVSDDELEFDDLNIDFRRGDLSEADFFGTLNERYGGDGTLAEKLLENPVFYTKQEMVYDLAQRIKDAGLKVAIFSNVYKPSAERLRARGLYDGFDPVILSCDVGFAKPDREFYEKAIELLDLEPAEILLIDDQDKCTVAAEAFGMKAIKALTPEQVVRDVSELMKVENQINL